MAADSKANALDLVSTIDHKDPEQSINDLKEVVDCLTVGELLDVFNTFSALTFYLEQRLARTTVTGEYGQYVANLH